MIFMKNKILTNNFKAAMIAALMLLMPGAAAAGGESKAVNNNISSSVMSLLSGQNGKVDSKGDMPDFAFPETVEKNARPLFEKALAEKNGVEALKYSVDCGRKSCVAVWLFEECGNARLCR